MTSDPDRDLRDLLEIESIRWSATIPTLDLHPVVAAILPPGEWLAADQVITLFKMVQKRLYEFRSSAMGKTRVVVSRDLKMAALAQLRPRQDTLRSLSAESPSSPTSGRESEMSAESGAPAHRLTDAEGEAPVGRTPADIANPVDSRAPAWDQVEEQQMIEQSVATAEKLQSAYAQGNLRNAEDFFEQLQQSRDTSLTIRSLKVNHLPPIDLVGTSMIFSSGGRERFPERFETKQDFHVVLHNFSDSNPKGIRAYIRGVQGSGTNPFAGELLNAKKPYYLFIESCPDALLLRQVALGDTPVEAIVTATVSVARREIESLTLCRVVAKEKLRPAIERIVAQLELDLVSSAGT